jgi:hypothetical protein
MRILISLTFLLIGCQEYKPKGKEWGQFLPKTPIHDYRIVIIDSCEYIEIDYRYDRNIKYSITHKGNCKNHLN